MSRTIRRKSKRRIQRRSRRKIVGGISITKSLAVALGLIAGAKGQPAGSGEQTLRLLDGREFTVRPGFSKDGVYMRKIDIPTPPQEYSNGLVVRPTDNSVTLSEEMKKIFQPVTITGSKLEEEYAKWVWIKKDDLCQVAQSLTSPWRPGENLLNCKTKSKYLALDTSE
jgi:hypothetical protein